MALAYPLTLPRGCTVARPARADVTEVQALLMAFDVATYGVGETSVEDALHVWDGIDLARDAWLCRDAAGVLRGYATVSPESDRTNCDYYTLPDPA